MFSVVFLHFTNTAKTRPNEKACRSSVSGFCPVVDTTHTTGRIRTHSGGRVCVRLSTLSILGRGLVTSSMCGVCPNCLYLSILCPVLRLWPPFALLWIWTHNGANIGTARAVPAFAAVSLLFSAVPYSLEHPSYFVKIIRLVLCGIKRRALVPLRVSFVCVFVCVVPIRGGLPGAACISNTSGESKRRMPRALLDVVRILSTLSIS